MMPVDVKYEELQAEVNRRCEQEMLVTYIDEEGLNVPVSDEDSWRKAIDRSINSQCTEKEEVFTIRLLTIPDDTRYSIFQCF